MSDEIARNHPPRLLVVVVNYRTPTLTIDCLRSLVGEVQSLPGIRVVVIDNASGDASVEQIGTAIKTENWYDWASLLVSERNGGYSFGCNAGIRPALQSSNPPDYFLLLNSDTLVCPKALQVLVDFMEQHPDVGIAGSCLENPAGEPWLKAFRFPTVLSELEAGLRLGVVSKLLSNWVVCRTMPEVPCQTDWVCGASMIVRREVFESVGLMDEGYFLWCEEKDLCLQAHRAGWLCWFVPQSRIIHIGGGGQSRKMADENLRQYSSSHWFNSRRRYFVKNYGLLYAAIADAAWILGFTLWRIRRIIQHKPDTDPPNLLDNFIRHSVFFKGSNLN